MTQPRAVQAGDQYQWIGIPGQHEMEAVIAVDSMTAACKINARVIYPDDVGLLSIGAADFFAALNAGWLVLDDQ